MYLLVAGGFFSYALVDDIFELAKTGIFINFLFVIPLDVILLAPVTTGQRLAIGFAEPRDEPIEQCIDGFDGLQSRWVFYFRRSGSVFPIEKTQVN